MGYHSSSSAGDAEERRGVRAWPRPGPVLASKKSKSLEDYIGLGSVDGQSLYGIPDYLGRRLMWPHKYYREAVANQLLAGKRNRAKGEYKRKENWDGRVVMRTASTSKWNSARTNVAASVTPKRETVKVDRGKALTEARRAFNRDLVHLIQHCLRYCIGAARDFLCEIQLSNKTEPPSRNNGKPGMDLYPIEFLLQAMGIIWLVLDFSNLNFENSEQNSGIEQLQSGLTIAILTSTVSIVINRCVYMSQNMLYKYVMQVAYTLTLLLHIFVVLPLTDGRPSVKAIANNHLKAFVLQQLAMLMVELCSRRSTQANHGGPTTSLKSTSVSLCLYRAIMSTRLGPWTGVEIFSPLNPSRVFAYFDRLGRLSRVVSLLCGVCAADSRRIP